VLALAEGMGWQDQQNRCRGCGEQRHVVALGEPAPENGSGQRKAELGKQEYESVANRFDGNMEEPRHPHGRHIGEDRAGRIDLDKVAVAIDQPFRQCEKPRHVGILETARAHDDRHANQGGRQQPREPRHDGDAGALALLGRLGGFAARDPHVRPFQ
jgi:hypothetical protein